MFTLNEGSKLIKLARKSIESKLLKKTLNFKQEQKTFPQKQGVFVTLITKSDELRGCVGFPYPFKPLSEAVVEAAQSAAFADPRFAPLKKEELKNIKIEISVLTEPKLIQAAPQELTSEIKVGKDGLIVNLSGFSGLLLPQVAPEQKWDSLEFLRGTCIKAGLPAETWLNPNCKVYKFQAQIFSEEKPNGKVVERRK
jgi:uncharacterized protein (TIGR00296 family)